MPGCSVKSQPQLTSPESIGSVAVVRILKKASNGRPIHGLASPSTSLSSVVLRRNLPEKTTPPCARGVHSIGISPSRTTHLIITLDQPRANGYPRGSLHVSSSVVAARPCAKASLPVRPRPRAGCRCAWNARPVPTNPPPSCAWGITPLLRLLSDVPKPSLLAWSERALRSRRRLSARLDRRDWPGWHGPLRRRLREPAFLNRWS